MFIYAFLWFYLIFKDFINIYNDTNKIIYISDHRKKGMYLSFNLTPILVL